MKINKLFSLYAVVALGFSIGLLTAPAFWIDLYGAEVDLQATVLIRLIGALFGGLAVMCWTGRNAEPSSSRDAMVLGLAVLNGLAAVVALSTAFSGVYNRLAWGPVGTFAILAVAFALTKHRQINSEV